MTPKAPSERSKRHLNMLASIAVCVGLMIAYYLSVGQGHIAPDTHIIFRRIDCHARCPAYQLDVLADGTVYYQAHDVTGLNGIYQYKLSKFALRRLLRTFARARYFELDPSAYPAPAGPQCTLTLISGQQKMALRHACGTTNITVARSVAAVDFATHMTQLTRINTTSVAGLYLQPSALPADNIVRPLTSRPIP